MASSLRPCRGSYENAKNRFTSSNPLKPGEIFFESDAVGFTQGKIKLGNGSTTYSALPYFLSMEDSSIGFTNSHGSNEMADDTLLDNIAPEAANKNVISNIKQLLWNHSKKIDSKADTTDLEPINSEIDVINSRIRSIDNSLNVISKSYVALPDWKNYISMDAGYISEGSDGVVMPHAGFLYGYVWSPNGSGSVYMQMSIHDGIWNDGIFAAVCNINHQYNAHTTPLIPLDEGTRVDIRFTSMTGNLMFRIFYIPFRHI